MSEEELATLRQRYATPGEGYGHFKMTLLEKINAHFEPYAQKSIMFPIFSEAGHYIVKLDTKQMLESAKEPFDTKNQ